VNVTVPERVVVPIFDTAVNVTVPLPEPDAADTDNQAAAFDDTLHARFEVTVTDWDPPPDGAAQLVGDTDTETPTCDTDTVALTLPAVNVIVPERATVPVFAAAVNVTVPLPEPDAADTDNQAVEFEDTVHDVFDVTDTDWDPPLTGAAQLVGDTDNVEATGAVAVTV